MLFTIANYARILAALAGSGLHGYTVVGYMQALPDDGFFILRHDVEADPHHALEMARLEAQAGLEATYYFHGPHRGRVFDPQVMRQIQEMGHEIGYHYETLDRARGDRDRARRLFDQDVKAFREAGVNLSTVAYHGNPRVSKTTYQSNVDLVLEDRDILDANQLIGEADRSIDVGSMDYVSDVGIRFSTVDRDVVAYLSAPERRKLLVLTHPDYWSRSKLRAFSLARLASLTRVAKPVARVAWVVKDRVSR